jgi:ribA/ribD-fused uncharacterized protein
MSSRLPNRKKTDPLPTKIGYFKGDWGFLSNFSPVEVRLWIGQDGVPVSREIPEPLAVEVYQSVEHGYQASKFLDAKIRDKFRMPGLAPGQAKNFAANLRERGLVRADWKDVSLEIMEGLLVQKFTYSILRRKLLSTFTAKLVEGNYWHDNFFGDCLCSECEGIPGQNHLGRLLEKIRNGSITPPSRQPSVDPSTS